MQLLVDQNVPILKIYMFPEQLTDIDENVAINKQVVYFLVTIAIGTQI